MVQAIDHEAVDGDMDQEVVERTCKLWIREQLKEILMVQAMDGAIYGTAMDEEAVEGDIWIRKLLKERWMVQAMEGAIVDHEAVEGDMDQGAIEGDIDGASDERSDRWYKRWITQSREIWIRKLSKER